MDFSVRVFDCIFYLFDLCMAGGVSRIRSFLVTY